MKNTTLILMGLLMLAASPPAMRLPAAVMIHPNDDFSGWKAEPVTPSARISLELGDTIESAVIEVVPHGDDDRDLLVQYQVETSMTIMDDGPHLDLVDWKHFTSDWTDLERIDARRFRMPKIESDYELASRFPAYTVDELYDAATAAGGRRWADLAREWPRVEDERVAVGISTVRIRVVAHEPEGIEPLFTLHVSVPMGC